MHTFLCTYVYKGDVFMKACKECWSVIFLFPVFLYIFHCVCMHMFIFSIYACAYVYIQMEYLMEALKGDGALYCCVSRPSGF